MEAKQVITPEVAEKFDLTAEAITRPTEPLKGARAVAAAWAALMREELEARPPATPEEMAEAEQEFWLSTLIEDAAEKVANLERDLEVVNRYEVNHHVTDGVLFEQEEALDDLRSAVIAWITPGAFVECYRACELPSLETNDPDDIAFEARCEVVQTADFVVGSQGDNNSLHTMVDAVVFWCRADDEFSDYEPMSPEACAVLACLRLFNERGRRTMVPFEEAGEEARAELLEMFGNLDGIYQAVGYVKKPAEAVA